MNVVKIDGNKEDSALIQNKLEEYLYCNTIFIINKDKDLYRFIEELEIDDSYLYTLKAAREIDFRDVDLELVNKFSERTIKGSLTSLSELLQELQEDKAADCQIIIDTEDKSLVSDVMQSLIYLNINIEVIMKKEKRDRERVNTFKQSFRAIKGSVINARKAIKSIEVLDKLENEKENVLDMLYEIENDLDKAQERDLNIAVMATKKAGKSVVVNSFLEEQYAPTSLELPTPNTCIYKKSADDKIRLFYGGEKPMYFESPEDIYKYTYNEFKRVQNDAASACTIDDMEIHYTNSKNDFAAFTVVDTPGPNYAGANNLENGENMHKKSAYKWIEKSDVILFLVNYSNYLSLDEESFLRDIKTQFEKHDKFYSLIVVVNKMDDMYMSECENKSVIRFLDYIKCKLHDLGYRGFIVLGASARSYFDSVKVARIDTSELRALGETTKIQQLSGSDLRSRLKKLKRKYIGKGQMNTLSFVDDQLEKLECFYGLDDVSLDTLMEKSGIPRLMDYTTYIAIQKANTELYGSIIRSIDERYVKIRNLDLIKSLIDARIEKQDQMVVIEKMLEAMIVSLETMESEINERLSFTKLQKELFIQVRDSRDGRIANIIEVYETSIDDFFMKLWTKDSYEIKEMKKDGLKLDFNISNKIMEEEFNRLVGSFLKQANDDLDQKERDFKEYDSRIKDTIRRFSEEIKKEYNLNDFEITVPKVEHAFRRKSLFRIPEVNIDNINIKEKVLDSIEFKENIIEKVINHFKEDKLGTYSMDSTKLREIKNNWLNIIKSNIENEYISSYSILEGNLLSCLNELKQQIDKSVDHLTSTYKDIFSEILEDLSTSKVNVVEQMEYLDCKLSFLKQIEEKMTVFTKVWCTVRM